MAIVGMDVEQVQALSGQLHNQAQAVDGVINAVNAIVNNLENVWKGNDANQFAGWWDSHHRPALLAAAQAIQGLAQSASANAADQANVSSH